MNFLGEQKRFLTVESRDDPQVQSVIQLLINWLNEELSSQRIVVKHIQEDLYDGQIIQKLIEKLANIKVFFFYFISFAKFICEFEYYSV